MGRRSVRLNRAEVVERAISIADAEGLEAASLRRLAVDHQVTSMAMYWHFNDKQALLDAMADHLLASVALPPLTDRPWPEQLESALGALLAALRPHPALAGLVPHRFLTAEPGLRLAERILTLLTTGGAESESVGRVGTFLLCGVVSLVSADTTAYPRAEGEDLQDAVRRKRASLSALSPEHFPHVIAAAPALTACREKDDFFAQSLAILVAGVERSLHGVTGA